MISPRKQEPICTYNTIIVPVDFMNIAVLEQCVLFARWTNSLDSHSSDALALSTIIIDGLMLSMKNDTNTEIKCQLEHYFFNNVDDQTI